MSNFYEIAAYHGRAAQKVCVKCGGKVNGGKRCDTCKAKAAASMAKIRADRKVNKLCLHCGDVAVAGRTLCEECEETHLQRETDRQAVNRANGVCPQCGRVPLVGGVCCGYHSNRHAIAGERRFEIPSTRWPAAEGTRADGE